MRSLKESAEEFLKLSTIAVAGVSSSKKDAANYIYEKLKKSGYKVFAINPNAEEVEGDKAYPNLAAIPGEVEGVVIGTSPKATLEVVKDSVENGVKNIWIHKSFDNGSYSKEAEDICIKNEINLIPAGCPMMFCKPVDFAHKCIKWVLSATGKIPKTIQ